MREFADFLAPGHFPDFCAQKSRDFFHIYGAHLRISIFRLTVIFSSFSNIRQIKNPGVADPECLSRILIFIHSGSRIKHQHQQRGKFFSTIFHFCSYKYHKIVKKIIFGRGKEIFLKPKTLRIIVPYLLPKNLSLSYQKYGFGIRDREKTYSGSPIRIRNTKKSLKLQYIAYYLLSLNEEIQAQTIPVRLYPSGENIQLYSFIFL